jgi:hypothetical protein
MENDVIMASRRRVNRSEFLISLGGFISALLIGSVVAFATKFGTSEWAIYLGAGVALLATLGTGLIGTRTASRTQIRHVRIALVGAPGVGKTVYATSLFDRLQFLGDSNLGFAPIIDTVGRVNETLGLIAEGKWPPSTASDYLYLYRAAVAENGRTTISRLAGRRRYEVEVADVAGEQLAEFVPGAPAWVDKTRFYRYAVSSDVLFLFLDFGTVEENGKDLYRQVNELIFVVQATCEEAGVGPSDRLEKPVALIVSKSDRSRHFDGRRESFQRVRHEVMEAMLGTELSRLVEMLRARCRWSAVFPVSATGEVLFVNGVSVVEGGRLRPVAVATPLFWALHNRFRMELTAPDSVEPIEIVSR